MNINKINAPKKTITIDKKKLQKNNKNIYEVITVIGKRANKINYLLKIELENKLKEFIIPTDTLEDVFENKEQIEISKAFERLPKPTSIAIEEFINDKIEYKYLK